MLTQKMIDEIPNRKGYATIYQIRNSGYAVRVSRLKRFIRFLLGR